MKQFNAEGSLHFLTQFVKAYRRCYKVTLVLTIDKSSGNIFLSNPSFPAYLEMNSIFNNTAWEITSNQVMTEHIMKQPELIQLCQGSIRMFS